MDFLVNAPKLRNSTAALVVFLCGYVAAGITAYNFLGKPVEAIWLMLCVVSAALLFMTLVFVISQLLKRTDVVDIAWGLVFIVIVLVSWLLNSNTLELGWNIQTVVTILVLLWGLRLSIMLFIRNMNRPEDARYVELRKRWKGSKVVMNAYIRIFVTQGLLAVVISAAVIIIMVSPMRQPDIYTYIGTGIWLIGFFFEVLGDRQLKQFIRNPKNKDKVLASGLWRYTRHPNYFGEATMWWGIFIIALSTYVGWLGIISPVIITFLLLFISGVPLAEKALAKRTGWKSYKARTSKFIPLLPRE